MENAIALNDKHAKLIYEGDATGVTSQKFKPKK
jgi:hypothetical protein